MNNFEHLKAHILPLSKSKVWEEAVLEWEYVASDFEKDSACPCTQYPITELCLLSNNLTGAQTHVGNVCVRRFMGIDIGSMRQGLRRIASNPHANPNDSLLDHCLIHGVLSQSEFDYLKAINRKRNFAIDQAARKFDLNMRILKALDPQAAERHAADIYPRLILELPARLRDPVEDLLDNLARWGRGAPLSQLLQNAVHSEVVDALADMLAREPGAVNGEYLLARQELAA